MRKFLSLLFGLGIGAIIGALLVTFFSPLSSDEFRAHYERALEAGRKASAERRKELEKELADLGKDQSKL
ncbi:MAG: hypothetical protein OXG78_07555 [Chloroflexi bacterium]|nr:hypothetical protein [Chloroflexota bacterium]